MFGACRKYQTSFGGANIVIHMFASALVAFFLAGKQIAIDLPKKPTHNRIGGEHLRTYTSHLSTRLNLRWPFGVWQTDEH